MNSIDLTVNSPIPMFGGVSQPAGSICRISVLGNFYEAGGSDFDGLVWMACFFKDSTSADNKDHLLIKRNDIENFNSVQDFTNLYCIQNSIGFSGFTYATDNSGAMTTASMESLSDACKQVIADLLDGVETTDLV